MVKYDKRKESKRICYFQNFLLFVSSNLKD
jgi:hypothetical protein